MKEPLDSVIQAELRHERDLEHAQEYLAARLDGEMDRVWTEVADGEHDEALSTSSWIEPTLMARIARIAACSAKKQFAPAIPAHDLTDLSLQIVDYVKDVAELNLS